MDGERRRQAPQHDGAPQQFQGHQKRHGKRPRGPNNWESRRGRPHRSKHTHAAASPKQKPACSVCNDETPKYKCPKCRVAYCSIACCKSHKEQGCQQETKKEEAKSKYIPSDTLLRDPLENALERRKQVAEDDDDLPEGWKITEAMMDKMDNCDWLRTELQDGGLRQILHQVCSAPNTVAQGQRTHQEVALEQAKAKYPNFSRFMDKLLVLTGVLERQETEQGLSEWLTLENAEELGPLALVPLPRKKRPVIMQQNDTEQDANDDDTSNSSDESDDSNSSDADSSEDSSGSGSDDEDDE